jgi:hypothetical protein
VYILHICKIVLFETFMQVLLKFVSVRLFDWFVRHFCHGGMGLDQLPFSKCLKYV